MKVFGLRNHFSFFRKIFVLSQMTRTITNVSSFRLNSVKVLSHQKTFKFTILMFFTLIDVLICLIEKTISKFQNKFFDIRKYTRIFNSFFLLLPLLLLFEIQYIKIGNINCWQLSGRAPRPKWTPPSNGHWKIFSSQKWAPRRKWPSPPNQERGAHFEIYSVCRGAHSDSL